MANKQPGSSYRQLQAQLDAVLAELESPSLDIDQALELYKQGQKLVEQLEKHLRTAHNEIIQLKK